MVYLVVLHQVLMVLEYGTMEQIYILKNGKIHIVDLILELRIQHLTGVTGIILQ